LSEGSQPGRGLAGGGAVVPGSFDPVTFGHLDIIERSSRLFDRVVVAVAVNAAKEPLFSMEERVEMLREVCGCWGNVTIDAFEGLLVEYMRSRSVSVIVRGLRVVSDFEYELQMAHLNRQLWSAVETVFVPTTAEHSYLSSSIVKEIARLGGSVEGLVPNSVRERLQARVGFQQR